MNHPIPINIFINSNFRGIYNIDTRISLRVLRHVLKISEKAIFVHRLVGPLTISDEESFSTWEIICNPHDIYIQDMTLSNYSYTPELLINKTIKNNQINFKLESTRSESKSLIETQILEEEFKQPVKLKVLDCSEYKGQLFTSGKKLGRKANYRKQDYFRVIRKGEYEEKGNFTLSKTSGIFYTYDIANWYYNLPQHLKVKRVSYEPERFRFHSTRHFRDKNLRRCRVFLNIMDICGVITYERLEELLLSLRNYFGRTFNESHTEYMKLESNGEFIISQYR